MCARDMFGASVQLQAVLGKARVKEDVIRFLRG